MKHTNLANDNCQVFYDNIVTTDVSSNMWHPNLPRRTEKILPLKQFPLFHNFTAT